MPQLGLTTVAGNAILNAFLRNVPLSFGIVALQLHDGHPGVDGTANVFTGAVRAAATYTAASSGAAALTGALPSFPITAAGTLAYVSAWNGLTGDGDAICFATGALLAPQDVSIADTVNLSTAPIAWTALAAA